MILNVTFNYSAQVIRGRKRTEEDVTLSSSVALLLPEHDAQDCPVAAWWSPPRIGDAAPRVAVRVVDGAPAEPVCMEGGLVDSGFVEPCGTGNGLVPAGSMTDGIDVSAILGGYLMSEPDPGKFPTRGELPPGTKMVGDNEARVAAQVRTLADGLCLVGGILHRRGGIPVLEADGYERSCRPRRVSAGRGEDFLDATRVHRLDRWDDAVAEGARDGRKPLPEPPVVWIPSALDLDMPALMARATAGRVANMADRDRARSGLHVGSLPTAALMAWVEVRDMYRADAHGRDLLPALRAFRDACGERAGRAFDHEIPMLDRCLARSADEQVDPALASMVL